MSNLPEVRRLMLEDFGDVEGDWVERMIYPINSFNEQTYNILNKGINITDNIQCVSVTTTFTTPSTYVASKTFNDVGLAWPFKTYPTHLLLGHIYETNGSMIKEATVITDWILASPGQIQVRFITGLKNSTKYTASFLIL